MHAGAYVYSNWEGIEIGQGDTKCVCMFVLSDYWITYNAMIRYLFWTIPLLNLYLLCPYHTVCPSIYLACNNCSHFCTTTLSDPLRGSLQHSVEKELRHIFPQLAELFLSSLKWWHLYTYLHDSVLSAHTLYTSLNRKRWRAFSDRFALYNSTVQYIHYYYTYSNYTFQCLIWCLTFSKTSLSSLKFSNCKIHNYTVGQMFCFGRKTGWK